MDRLQAEADRLSAEVRDTAAPIANKLSTGLSSLQEVSRSAGSPAGSRLSQLTGRLTAKLAASGRSVAVQMGTVKDGVKGVTTDLGSTAAGRLAGALGRGADKILPAVGEAGRIVKDGASTLSKAASGSLPVVQEQTSALSSQIGSAVGGAGKALNEGVSKLSQVRFFRFGSGGEEGILRSTFHREAFQNREGLNPGYFAVLRWSVLVVWTIALRVVGLRRRLESPLEYAHFLRMYSSRMNSACCHILIAGGGQI